MKLIFWRQLSSLIVLALLGERAIAETSVCTTNSSERKVVELQTQRSALSFYYRSGEYVIFVTDNALTKQLAEYELKLRLPQSTFRSAIAADLPLTRNIDLFGYVLSKGISQSSVDSLVADILENGQAVVIRDGDLFSGKPFSKLQLFRIKRDAAGFREFCSPGGNKLLSVLDYIK